MSSTSSVGAAAASVLVCLAAFAVRLLVSSLFLRVPSSLLRASLRISFLEVCGSRALQANPKKQKTMIIMIIPEVPLFRRQVSSLLILTNRLSRVQVSTASSAACLRVWGRLPDGWTSPDDAKIAAAAAIEGTLRSGPSSLDALGLARSREGKIQFFLKGHDGCTRDQLS